MQVDEVRRLAVMVLAAVERGIFLDGALEKHRVGLETGGSEIGRLHFLSTGTVKWMGRLDYELNHRLPRGLESLPVECRAILRLALFEIRVAGVPEYAAVDAAVEMSRVFSVGGLSPLINGVLRNSVREGEPGAPEDPLERLALEHSHPAWILKDVADKYGMDAATALAVWDNEPAPLWVRVNGRHVTVEEAIERMAEEGVSASAKSPVPGYLLLEEGTVPVGLRGLVEGWLTVQDPSAGIASLASMPLDGVSVADTCAAPGGKSTHLVELGGNGVEVVASDSDPERFKMLEETAGRHGSHGLSLRPYDEVMAALGQYLRVLVDAPCSNLGVLRRRADARWRVQPGDPELLAEVQYQLLSKAGELVCPGGVLVYSTCSLLPVENEMVVDRFLSHHTAFILDQLPVDVPEMFAAGNGTALSLPWRDGLDGAFVARMKRREENQ